MYLYNRVQWFLLDCRIFRLTVGDRGLSVSDADDDDDDDDEFLRGLTRQAVADAGLRLTPASLFVDAFTVPRALSTSISTVISFSLLSIFIHQQIWQ